MQTPPEKYDRRISDIRANTVHIPVAAAVWRIPDLIYASVYAGVIGLGVLGAIGLSALIGSYSPVFNKVAREGWEYYETCVAQTSIENPGAPRRLIERACENRRILFEADLRTAAKRDAN